MHLFHFSTFRYCLANVQKVLSQFILQTSKKFWIYNIAHDDTG